MWVVKIRINTNEFFFTIATLCIVPLRIFTYIATMSNTFRLTLTFTAIACYLLGVITSENKERNKHLLLFIVVFLFCTMNYYGQWKLMITYSEKMYAYLLFFIPFLLSFHYVNSTDHSGKSKLLKIILLMELITLVTTIIGLRQYPNAARDLASTVAIERYKQMNIGGYDFIFGLVILVPFVIYLRNMRSKGIFTIILIVMLYTITISQYTTALVIALYVLLLYPIERMKNRPTATVLKLVLILFLIGALLLSDYMLGALGNFFTNIGLTTVAQKFIDVSTTRSILAAGTLGDRITKSISSLFSFYKSPFLGKMMNPALTIGGHSELFDMMASGGIAIIFLCIYLARAFRLSIYSVIPNSEQRLMMRYMMIALLFIALFDTVFNSPVIAINAFLIPSLLINRYSEYTVQN